MDRKLFVELFRFNHKTDYLPYYKKHRTSFNDEDTVLDLLNKINKVENFSFDGVENFGIKINNLFLSTNELVSDIVKETSNEFKIEPVSIYRAINDLTINNQDFFDKVDLFDKYLSSEQKETYSNTLQLEYYASNSLNFNKAYMGDHSFIIASDIIEQDESLSKEVLSLITNEDGILLHTSVEKRLFKPNSINQQKINLLLLKVTKTEQDNSVDEINIVKEISQEFTDFNIAVYDKNNTDLLKDIIVNSKAKYIDIETKNDDLALYSQSIDDTFSYKIAGRILLDAKDNNADFIVVNGKESFTLFDQEQKKIEKVVGRDINIPVVTISQFNDMLLGEKDISKLGFNTHKVNVTFL